MKSYERACINCGGSFRAKRKDAIYCSGSCRVQQCRDKKENREFLGVPQKKAGGAIYVHPPNTDFPPLPAAPKKTKTQISLEHIEAHKEMDDYHALILKRMDAANAITDWKDRKIAKLELYIKWLEKYGVPSCENDSSGTAGAQPEGSSRKATG